MKRKQIVNYATVELLELLFCGDGVGLAHGMHFISAWVFGITYCSAHTKAMKFAFLPYECAHGCECRLRQQWCTIIVVLEIWEARDKMLLYLYKEYSNEYKLVKGIEKGVKSFYEESERNTKDRLE